MRKKKDIELKNPNNCDNNLSRLAIPYNIIVVSSAVKIAIFIIWHWPALDYEPIFIRLFFRYFLLVFKSLVILFTTCTSWARISYRQIAWSFVHHAVNALRFIVIWPNSDFVFVYNTFALTEHAVHRIHFPNITYISMFDRIVNVIYYSAFLMCIFLFTHTAND